jgi:hypothetical protein
VITRILTQSQRSAQAAAPHRPKNHTIENQNNASSRDMKLPGEASMALARI